MVVQLRTGILLLPLEVGRYKNIQVDGRLCESRDFRKVEVGTHSALYCPFCDELRTFRNVLVSL